MTLNKHKSVFLTQPTETKEQKQHRIEAQKAHQEYRKEKAEKRKGGAINLDLVNSLRELGVDSLAEVPGRLEGCRIDRLTSASLQFLKENFPIAQMQDKSGQKYLHFFSKREKERKNEAMNLVREITDKLADQGDGVPYKLVRGTIAAMLEVVQEQLKKERRVRIPGLVTLRIRYKPAQKGGQKKINPFTKESYISKAKKAENKLKANPAKQLKDYTAKLAVIASKRKATAA